MLLPKVTPVLHTWDVVCHGSKLTSHVMPVLTATVWQPFIYSSLILNNYTQLFEVWEKKDSSPDFSKMPLFSSRMFLLPRLM